MIGTVDDNARICKPGKKAGRLRAPVSLDLGFVSLRHPTAYLVTISGPIRL